MRSRICTICAKPSVIVRSHEGRSLCRRHFMESVERNARKYVGKHRMIESGDRIGVALSGGKDSAVALYVLKNIVGKRKDVSLCALSIDEGIAGSRDAALKKAKQLCKKLGVKHCTFSFRKELGMTLDAKVRKLKLGREGVCGFCGIARRWILNREARGLGLNKLALGINLNDEAESIMMNYVRGDMLRAARLGPVTNYSISGRGARLFIPRIKPLRMIPEPEIELYAKFASLPFHPKHCRYRGGIRIDVEKSLDMLEKRYPGTMFTIVSTFDRILPGIRSAVAQEGYVLKCKKCGEPASKDICKCCELWRNG
ncbi:MAG: TIGR00269 family protein [Candidatus Aenigmarchaeota archaeon]|nr:TIGR00269 family protein [Candidatus Aenigmarchaeota archaeon]